MVLYSSQELLKVNIILYRNYIETDFNDIPNLRANWDKIYAAEQRRKEEER